MTKIHNYHREIMEERDHLRALNDELVEALKKVCAEAGVTSDRMIENIDRGQRIIDIAFVALAKTKR